MLKELLLIDHPEQLYEGCLIGKHHQATFFEETSFHAAKSLQLVNIYVCGLITPTSLVRLSNFLFLPRFLSQNLVYFLKNKYEIFTKIKRSKANIGKKVVLILKLSDQNKVESSLGRSSKPILKSVVFVIFIKLLIYHRKMGLLKKRIELFWNMVTSMLNSKKV